MYRSDSTNEAKHLLELKDPKSTLVMSFRCSDRADSAPVRRYEPLPHRAARDLVHLAIFVGCHQGIALRLIAQNCFLMVLAYAVSDGPLAVTLRPDTR